MMSILAISAGIIVGALFVLYIGWTAAGSDPRTFCYVVTRPGSAILSPIFMLFDAVGLAMQEKWKKLCDPDG